MRELVQRQARALGDPTRYEIFRFIADSPLPVRIGALVERFGFNHNAIRQHLAKLVDARLLTEELSSSGGTGRPPLQYRVAPAAVGTWGAPGPYELLAVLLLDVAAGRATPQEAGAKAGRRVAADYGEGADPLEAVESEMARRGFEPRRERTGPLVEVILERCPFAVAAAAEPDVVCCAHQGLAEGMLDALGSDLEVSALVAYPPEQAGCRLQLRPRSGATSPSVA